MNRADVEALQSGDLVRVKVANGIVKGNVVQTFVDLGMIQVRPNTGFKDLIVRCDKVEFLKPKKT